MDLLADDNEWDQALEEAGVWASGWQLRDIFWRALKSRGETHLRVSQSQVAEIVT
jgi:hypothetical protein